MSPEEFYKQFTSFVKSNRNTKANMVLMNEIGRILIHKRDDLIYVLKYSGLEVDKNANDLDLIDLFVNNIDKNKKLMLGTAFLISHTNKMVGFDGVEYTSNICADAIHKSMNKYFAGAKQDGYFDGETMSNFDGDMLNMYVEREFANIIDNDLVGHDIIGASKFSNAAVVKEINQKPISNAAQKTIAKNAILCSAFDEKSGVLEIKKASADENKKKTMMYTGIAGVALISLVIVGVINKHR